MGCSSNAIPDAGERASNDGQVATIRSNCRWCSDALEFSCWNGEVVRVAFALDCHDREAISWVATTAGISGEMIRDMMVQCVEKRFGTIRAPHWKARTYWRRNEQCQQQYQRPDFIRRAIYLLTVARGVTFSSKVCKLIEPIRSS